MRHFWTGTAAVGLLAASTLALAAEPMAGGTLYRLTIAHDSELNNSSRPRPSKSLNSMSYDFRAAREGDRVELAIDRITRTLSPNGRMNHSEETRSGITRQSPEGRITTTDRTTMTPNQLAFYDQMEASFVVLTLDAEGGEVRRELKAGALFTPQQVDILRTFSPRFPRDKAEWDVKPRLLLSPDETMQGTLHYVKRPAARPGGPVEVDVSGTLTIAGKLADADIKSGRDEVKGVQTYDPALGEWVAGKLTIAREIEAVAAGGETRSIREATVMTLVRQDPPAAAAKGTSPPP